jgi:MFS family permease
MRWPPGWQRVSPWAVPSSVVGRGRRILGAVVADTRPLRESAHFRRLWVGITVGQLGQQMTNVAVAYQVWSLSRSSFAVGLLGAAAVVSMIVFGLYGGTLVDTFDRRRVAIIASTALWLLSVVLVLQAVLDLRRLWLLYVVVAGQAAFFAVNNPARQSIVPRLLPPELLPSANALSTLSFSLGFTAGPLAGGFLLAVSGGDFTLPYAVDALTYLAALYALWRLPPVPPQGPPRRAGFRSMLEGFRFVRARTDVLMTFLVDLCAMVLAQPRALFPELADTVYGGGSRTLGVLQAAPAMGALVAAMSSGWLHRNPPAGAGDHRLRRRVRGERRDVRTGRLAVGRGAVPGTVRSVRHGQCGVPVHDPSGGGTGRDARQAAGRLRRGGRGRTPVG